MLGIAQDRRNATFLLHLANRAEFALLRTAPCSLKSVLVCGINRKENAAERRCHKAYRSENSALSRYSVISSRCRPYKTESIDHAPGPSMASAAPLQMSRIAGCTAIPPIITNQDSA